MNEFSYFEKLGRSVEVQLKHQELDGHVSKFRFPYKLDKSSYF